MQLLIKTCLSRIKHRLANQPNFVISREVLDCSTRTLMPQCYQIMSQVDLKKRLAKKIGGTAFKFILSNRRFFDGIRIILAYHRVTENLPDALYDPGMFVTQKTLEMHINEILHCFDIVPLSRIVGTDEPRRVCAITFDDGWVDTYLNAFPVLKRYGVPAAVFVPVNMIDSDKTFWFQDLWDLAIKIKGSAEENAFLEHFARIAPSWHPRSMDVENIARLTNILKNFPAQKLNKLVANAFLIFGLELESHKSVMSLNEIHEMSENGITFGSHGLDHYILPNLNSQMKKAQILDSFEILQDKLHSVIPFFCYPDGRWDDESIAFVKEAGYEGAVTTILGHNSRNTDRFLLVRILMHEDISDSPSLFWFRILQALFPALART